MENLIINNYELRRPYTLNKHGDRVKQTKKDKFLILIHYPTGKHYLFITTETERQLLKRIKSICYDASDKIKYLNVYRFLNAEQLEHYGEFTYRNKEIKNNGK